MNAKLFIKKNASTILTGLVVIGVVATTVSAVKATPRALDLIMEDGLEVYIIEMPFDPTYDFLEY